MLFSDKVANYPKIANNLSLFNKDFKAIMSKNSFYNIGEKHIIHFMDLSIQEVVLLKQQKGLHNSITIKMDQLFPC